ncbi:MAG: NAD(+) synthase [Bacteroidaceae bacterium]
MNHGFVRLASAVPSLRVADCSYNAGQIALMMGKAREMKVAVVCFPELSITSYTCQDLFRQKRLLDEAEEALRRLLEATRENPVVGIVGMPVRYLNVLLNCAVVFQRGRVLGVVAKTFLPNYNEFYEMRWFTSVAHVPEGRLWLAGQQVELTRNRLFRTPDFTFGVELCEDLWAPVPPSSHLCLRGAEVVFNLSADNDLVGKTAYLQTLVEQQSARCICGYVYSGCGFGESTQDLVFGGKSLVYENGARLLFRHQRDTMPHLEAVEVDIDRIRAERMANTTFSAASEQVKDMQVGMVQVDDVVRMDMVTDTLTRWVNPHPFVPSGRHLDLRCEEIFGIQTLGLAKRVEHTHARHLVLGISGGLDSTLALLVCARTTDLLGLPRHTIVGVTMPGFGTTGRTYNNAMDLMKTLGVTIREISVKDACVQHFKDIGHDAAVHDVTYENSQARERTQILMDVANQMNGLVVGTGDLSELALGWATYNGDHMSMYGVNVSVPKTLVKHLVGWVADRGENAEESRILRDIIDTPISPELIPADEQGNITQKTEDLVGPYELHDFFLYHFLRQGSTPEKIRYLALHAFRGVYDDAFISKWLNTFIRRFFNQQFKRSCLPDGPKVGSCSLSPRGDWRMPTDASSEAWKFQ